MVVIHGNDKNNFIKTQVDALYEKNNANQRFWIGLKKTETKGSYVWVDGTELTFGEKLEKDPWLDSEPNQVNKN